MSDRIDAQTNDIGSFLTDSLPKDLAIVTIENPASAILVHSFTNAISEFFVRRSNPVWLPKQLVG